MEAEKVKRIIAETEKLLVETKRCVEKGWERKSRLVEVERYLEEMRKTLVTLEQRSE